jgi:hypothetical protein
MVATALSGGFLGNFGGSLASGQPGPSQLASLRVAPTAIAVGASQVRWLNVRQDGAFAYNVATIGAVCPLNRQPDCAPFADGHARRVTLNATPKFVFQSPVDNQAVVVGTDAVGADAVIVVPLPTPETSPQPPPSAPAASTDLGSPDSSVPSATVEASASPSAAPMATPIESTTATPTWTPNVSFAEPSPSAFPAASTRPEPSSGGAFAIITDITIVGRSAGYSPDGTWFAFSARPADGSSGPDIYVWHPGDPIAVALTTNHASVFASWVGNQLLGSRITPNAAGSSESTQAGPVVDASTSPGSSPTPTPTPTPAVEPSSGDVVGASSPPEATPAPEFDAETFLIDPLTGLETPMLGADWQPVVDPTGAWVLAWEGTVRAAPDGFSMVPATGRLVVHAFQAVGTATGNPVPSDQPSAEPSGLPSVEPTSPPSAEPSTFPILPDGGSPAPSDNPFTGSRVVAEGPIAEFDARWDDTGTWLAVWLADAVDPSIGRLSLLHMDPLTGLLDRPPGAPQDVPALPGFSIGAGRLAWATPPGQDAEGSRIQIIAWTQDQVGAVESVPVEGAIVVQ